MQVFYPGNSTLPVSNGIIHPIGSSRWLTEHFEAYTSSVNVLDYTSIVIPVTFADQEIDIVSPNFKALNEEDRLSMEHCKPFTSIDKSMSLMHDR